MGNEDGVPQEGGAGVGDAALAIARRSVEKDRLAGSQRRSEPVEHARGKNEMVEGGPQHLVGDRITAPTLMPGHGHVDVERHRGRPRVLVDLDQFLGTLPTAPGDRVLEAVGELDASDRAPDPGRRDVALIGEELERVADHVPG